MNWVAVRKGVALVRSIRYINHAVEANIDAEYAASYASDFKIGSFQTADASLYSTRHDLVERMDELFDLTPDERSIFEDKEIGGYAQACS